MDKSLKIQEHQIQIHVDIRQYFKPYKYINIQNEYTLCTSIGIFMFWCASHLIPYETKSYVSNRKLMDA